MGFSLSALSPTSIRVSVQVISGYNYYEIAYRPSYTTTAVFEKMWAGADYIWDLTGLEAGEEYLVNVGYSTHDGDYSFMGGKSIQLPSAPVVTPWSWTTTETGAASLAPERQRAYATLVSRGPTSDFSFKVWNDIVDKANEVVDARNHIWNTDYGTVAAAKMNRSDRRMTAGRFNAVWWNMGQFVATGLSRKYPGDTVRGADFLTLTDAINRAIP